MYEWNFPFEPPWTDLKLEMTAQNGARVYLFDTFSRAMTKGEKEQADRHILELYREAAEEQLLQAQLLTHSN